MRLRPRPLLTCTVALLAVTGLGLPAAGAASVYTPIGSVTTYAGPIAAKAAPSETTLGTDGAIWFTESGANKIGRIDPFTRVITEFADTGVAGGAPEGITTGPDASIWFVDSAKSLLGRLDIHTHLVTHYSLGRLTAWDLTGGPDGAIWFTEANGYRIGRFNLVTHGVTTYGPTGNQGAYPYITRGADGGLWFTEYGAGMVARIDPATKAVLQIHLPTANSGPAELVSGRDGAIWLTEYLTNKVARITWSGLVTEYSVPTANSGPYGIVVGSDGGIWFGEYSGNKIGRISTTGLINEFAAAGTGPDALTAGPDGAVWFAAYDAGRIGRITTGIPGRPLSVTATSGAASIRAAWALPTDLGVNPISVYVATAYPGGRTCVTAALTCVIPGLVNGAAYRVYVRATNGAGSSAISLLSNVAVPRPTPSEVRSLAVHSTGVGRALATWLPPATNGGIPLIGYLVRRHDKTTGLWTTWVRVGTLSAALTGVVKHHVYLVQVVAVNHSGLGVITGFTYTQTL